MPDGNADTATQPPDNNDPAPADSSAARLPPLSQAPPLALKSNDIRELVLDYLSHSCYVDSAIAFAKEWDEAECASRAAIHESSPASPTAGPSTSTFRTSMDPPSTRRASHAFSEEVDDDTDDQMMQSVHGSFNYAALASTTENGNSAAAYHDRHHRSTSYKHLNLQQIEHIRARNEIKRLIRQGSVQAAIDLCNLHFPSVLDTSSSLSTKSSATTLHPYTSLQQWSRVANATPSSSSPSLRGFFNKRTPHSGDNSPSVPSFTNNLVSKNVPTQSLLLSLSLQIQLFIEVVRSAAPPLAATSSALTPVASISRPTTPLNNVHSPSSPNGSMDGSIASLASNTSQGSQASRMSSVRSNGSTSSTSAISQALSQAQALHAQASQISDPTTKSIYLKELEAVAGLLPYRDPRNSPMAFYLDESRRNSLAEAVNGAILLSLGETSTNSKIENLIKHNEHVWQTLHELNSTYPAAKGAGKNEAAKPVLPFSLQDFLSVSIDNGTDQQSIAVQATR